MISFDLFVFIIVVALGINSIAIIYLFQEVRFIRILKSARKNARRRILRTQSPKKFPLKRNREIFAAAKDAQIDVSVPVVTMPVITEIPEDDLL